LRSFQINSYVRFFAQQQEVSEFLVSEIGGPVLHFRRPYLVLDVSLGQDFFFLGV
jgi:hypothetical protein